MSWTLIESVSLSSSQASVTLGSGGTIPQTYKTLKLVCSMRSDTAAASNGFFGQLRLNAATTNHSARRLQGDGSNAYSYTDTVIYIQYDASDHTANTFGNVEISIPNYAGSTNKPVSMDSVYETNATAALQTLTAGLWSNTAAVTSIALVPTAGNFVSGSTFTLYGLA